MAVDGRRSHLTDLRVDFPEDDHDPVPGGLDLEASWFDDGWWAGFRSCAILVAFAILLLVWLELVFSGAP